MINKVLSDEKRRLYYDQYGDMDSDNPPDMIHDLVHIVAFFIVESLTVVLTPIDDISIRFQFIIFFLRDEHDRLIMFFSLE